MKRKPPRPKVKPASLEQLLVSLVLFEALGTMAALSVGKDPGNGAQLGFFLWMIVFGIWALLITFQD